MSLQIQSGFNLKSVILIIIMSFLCIKNVHGQSSLFAESANYPGVWGISGTSFGVYGVSTSSYGVRGTSIQYHGAIFMGDKDNGYADIILSASSTNSTGDNGVIRSDPNVSGSDIFLEANDAVVAKIDRDNIGGGNFFVFDGNNTNLFQVTLDGTVLVKGTTVHGSDRHRKEQITDVSYPEILKAIKEMPIYEWQYIGQERRHIGPMAQDFHKAFGLGDDDKIVAAIDADGVALAAIKAQQEIIEKQEDRISLHEAEINSLKQKVDELELMKEEIALLKAMITERASACLTVGKVD